MRIYKVVRNDESPNATWLVYANSQSQALRRVIEPKYQVSVATTIEVARHLAGGGTVMSLDDPEAK